MIKNIAKSTFISLLLLIGSGAARAEDIDIFYQRTAINASAPNVLIILDNTSNWNLQFNYEMDALKSVFTSLSALPAMNIGIMEQAGGAADGGYVRFAVRNVGGTSTAASTNRTALGNIIQEIMTHGQNSAIEKANNPTYAQTYNEAYLYLQGRAPRAGLGDDKRDCGSSNSANNPNASPLGSYAYTSCAATGVTYISPIDPAAVCQKTFIIYISNGPIANNDNAPGRDLLTAVNGDTSVIAITPNAETDPNFADEWARFLYKDMGVVSYTINVNPSSSGQGPAHTAMMQSIANVGGGRYCESTDQASVQACLSTFFNEILALNGVFASTALPLSADNSGTYLNQLYVGMFRPDEASKPRWYGNLKQYKFAYVTATNSLVVVDSNGVPAANASTGVAQPDAVSYWTSKDTSSAPDAPATVSTGPTTGSRGGFWSFNPKGSGGSYDLPDGQWVEKGGAAQQLRLAYLGYGSKGGIGDTNASMLNSKPARQMYTCTGSCLTAGSLLSNTPFDSTNTALTDIAFGVSSGAATLIKWIRGQDTQNENLFQVNGQNTDVRASIHGDILHSRPVVLNYGSSGTSNLYVFYGGNDGVFRAIKGGQTANDGKEQWAFIPQEFFRKLPRLYYNSPLVLYPSTGIMTFTSRPRDYAFDGPVGSYIERNASGTVTKAYLYIAVRRGGRFIYALDVTSPTAPRFLWRISSNDAGFAELGQTWSQPNVVKIRANANPVLIFGGGYDAASEDTEPPAAMDQMGRGVFIVDAFNGSLVWSFANSANNPSQSVSGMNFSIAGDVLPVDRNFDGYIDRVYAADVGGNVWRFDIDDVNKRNWIVSKLATLADRTRTATSRKFLFGMDFVFGENFDAIVLGSGDREHPLVTNMANGVTNRMYMFKDPYTGTAGAALGIVDTSTETSPGLFDATNSNGIPANALGWYINLASGEKVISAPVVAAGNVLFGTNQPDTSPTSCTANLGIARRYSVDYREGSGMTYTNAQGTYIRSEIVHGGGFLPSPVTGVADVDGKDVVFALDNPLSPGGSQLIKITTPTKRYRTYWYEKLE